MLRGLLSRIKLKWYEGVFVGVLLVLIMVVYVLSAQLSDTEEQLVVSELAIEQAQHLQEVTAARQQIDAQVVSTINESLHQDRREQQQFREELIRDYLIYKPQAAERESSSPPDPETATDDVASVASTDTPRVSEAPAPETPDVARSGDRDRLGHLARGMRSAYCGAADADDRCATEQSD